MYIYFILHLYIIYTFDFCYFTTIRPKRRKNSKNPNVIFTECKYAAYLLNLHVHLINGRNVCGAIFCKGAIHKVRMLKKANLFLFRAFPCMHFEKKWRHRNNKLWF